MGYSWARYHSDSRQKPIPKVNQVFGKIPGHAGLKHGTFRDLRCTAISNWLAKRLSEFEVMKLAGHLNFSTTYRFYLRVRDDMIDRARKASTRATSPDLARIWHAPPSVSDAQKADRSNVLSVPRL